MFLESVQNFRFVSPGMELLWVTLVGWSDGLSVGLSVCGKFSAGLKFG